MGHCFATFTREIVPDTDEEKAPVIGRTQRIVPKKKVAEYLKLIEIILLSRALHYFILCGGLV